MQQKAKEEEKELNEQILKAEKARQKDEKIQKAKELTHSKLRKKIEKDRKIFFYEKQQKSKIEEVNLDEQIKKCQKEKQQLNEKNQKEQELEQYFLKEMKLYRKKLPYQCFSIEGDKLQKEIAEKCIQDIKNKQKPRKKELEIFKMGLKPENHWFEQFILFKQQNTDNKNTYFINPKDICRKMKSHPKILTKNKKEIKLDINKPIQDLIEDQHGEKDIYDNYINNDIDKNLNATEGVILDNEQMNQINTKKL